VCYFEGFTVPTTREVLCDFNFLAGLVFYLVCVVLFVAVVVIVLLAIGELQWR
jgi:hypothetical protein